MPVIDVFQQEVVRIPEPFMRQIRVLLAPDTQDVVAGMSVSHAILAPNGGCTDFHMHPGG